MFAAYIANVPGHKKHGIDFIHDAIQLLVTVSDPEGLDLYLVENPVFVKNRSAIVLKFVAGEKSVATFFQKARDYYRSTAAEELFGGQTEGLLTSLDVMEAQAQADKHMEPFVVMIVFPESSDGEQLRGLPRGRSSSLLASIFWACFASRHDVSSLPCSHTLSSLFTVFQVGAETDADVSAQPLVGESSIETMVGRLDTTVTGLLFHIAIAGTETACSGRNDERLVDVTSSLTKKMAYMGIRGGGRGGAVDHDGSTSDSDQESQGMLSFILSCSSSLNDIHTHCYFLIHICLYCFIHSFTPSTYLPSWVTTFCHLFN